MENTHLCPQLRMLAEAHVLLINSCSLPFLFLCGLRFTSLVCYIIVRLSVTKWPILCHLPLLYQLLDNASILTSYITSLEYLLVSVLTRCYKSMYLQNLVLPCNGSGHFSRFMSIQQNVLSIGSSDS